MKKSKLKSREIEMRKKERLEKRRLARKKVAGRTWKEVEEDIAFIEEYFKDRGYYVNLIADNLIIKTEKSKWRIDFACLDEIILWHGNSIVKHRTGHHNSFDSDYHVQFYVTDLRTIPRYILSHDKGKYSVNDYSKKVLEEKRMQALFDAI